MKHFETLLQIACRKYEERISGIENGAFWKDIKTRQKQALELEQGHFDNKIQNEQKQPENKLGQVD